MSLAAYLFVVLIVGLLIELLPKEAVTATLRQGINTWRLVILFPENLTETRVAPLKDFRGKQFIVRCHVTSKEPVRARDVEEKFELYNNGGFFWFKRFVVVSSFGSIWRRTKDFSYILDWRQNQIGRGTFFQSLQEAVHQGHPTTVSFSIHRKHF